MANVPVRIGGTLYPSQEWYDSHIGTPTPTPPITAPATPINTPPTTTPVPAVTPAPATPVGTPVRIGGTLYPSQQWYDENVGSGTTTPTPQPATTMPPGATGAPLSPVTPQTGQTTTPLLTMVYPKMPYTRKVIDRFESGGVVIVNVYGLYSLFQKSHSPTGTL